MIVCRFKDKRKLINGLSTNEEMSRVEDFNFMLRGAVAFYVAALLYLSKIIRNRKALSKEIDQYAEEAPDKRVTEEEKSKILMKTHQMIMKPLKMMIVFIVIGTILGIAGLFM